MPSYYPPVGFHFKVEVLGVSPNDSDVRFTDVSGLSVELASEEVAEGGENRFLQQYPVRAKYPPLVLKRGMLTKSPVVDWVLDCLDLRIEPKSVDVTLLNEEHRPLITWHLAQAFPTKWAMSDLSATSNAIVVETLQMFYQRFTVERG